MRYYVAKIIWRCGYVSTLRWNGDEVLRHTLEATRRGIDLTMADCVGDAKADAPVRTATYQGSIQLRPAVITTGGVFGLWGSFQCNYALIIEEGSKPHVIRPRNKKALYWPGAAHPVAKVQHPGTKPQRILQNAADKNYPYLVNNIRGNM